MKTYSIVEFGNKLVIVLPNASLRRSIILQDSYVLGAKVVITNAFAVLQEGDEFCPTDGPIDVSVDTVPSSRVKDKLPSIENLSPLEGVGAQPFTHVDMQAVTAACVVLPDGGASDSLNGTSAGAPALIASDEDCSLTCHSVGASNLQATLDARQQHSWDGGKLIVRAER
ncbi:hypothetical protein Nepgr_010572 [Nepenthes gracilis]|uniref:Uncharacterized protein n=1 Tax=Nepenthes gracilis TaxID=150966 RepID=A0AAD3SDP5_NEPGR|nr:hypothetical protein Nepgr_010572 [Nepenthes gracilis]